MTVPHALLPPALRYMCRHDSFTVDGCVTCEAADAIEHAYRKITALQAESERAREVLYRMLEAPTTQISLTWKDAARHGLALGHNDEVEPPRAAQEQR